ncbi:helix-turn-helix domain-containing protein [Nocardia sp. SYP-A9097]|uniref:helix-turn-helix domain-containing protein n=1 Tax=Nocardia sp. SYP-A9097 TaxID=2663237 RepID=UPI00129B6816|nr:helix-turn-helix transcriptional regulator [Nocardia sp. SYP-A9097]MRH89681.1 helix-turn-helix domain-containing protein [Nocardia sp. SYP-A9097]
MSEQESSTLPRRQLGRYLREAREAANLTIEEAANLMEWGKSTLQRLEKGQTGRIRVREIDGLCQLYSIDDEKAAALKGLAQQAPARSWWHAYGDLIPANFNLYVGLEASARTLTIYQPLIIPGLLQTADYARTLDRTYFHQDTDNELNRRIEVRMRRQAVLLRNRKPVSGSFVLHEAAIRTRVGDRHIMAGQLRHMANLSTRDNISIRVLPYRAGYPLGMPLPSFVILEFATDPRGRPVEPTVIFAESFTGGMYFERSTDVDKYRQAFLKVQQSALDANPSRDVLRELAREIESDR